MKNIPFIVTKAKRTGALEPNLKKKKIEETIVHIRTTTVPRRTGNMAAVKKN